MEGRNRHRRRRCRRRQEEIGGGEEPEDFRPGGGDGEEGVSGGDGNEVGAEERVGGLELVESGIEEGAGDRSGEEEGEDSDAGPALHGPAPAVLGAADGPSIGGPVVHSRGKGGGKLEEGTRSMARFGRSYLYPKRVFSSYVATLR